MFCSNCSKLAYLYTKKTCIRCQGEVLNNISVLCEFCSKTEKQCASCLKKVYGSGIPGRRKGCNCGGK